MLAQLVAAALGAHHHGPWIMMYATPGGAESNTTTGDEVVIPSVMKNDPMAIVKYLSIVGFPPMTAEAAAAESGEVDKCACECSSYGSGGSLMKMFGVFPIKGVTESTSCNEYNCNPQTCYGGGGVDAVCLEEHIKAACAPETSK